MHGSEKRRRGWLNKVGQHRGELEGFHGLGLGVGEGGLVATAGGGDEAVLIRDGWRRNQGRLQAGGWRRGMLGKGGLGRDLGEFGGG